MRISKFLIITSILFLAVFISQEAKAVKLTGVGYATSESQLTMFCATNHCVNVIVDYTYFLSKTSGKKPLYIVNFIVPSHPSEKVIIGRHQKLMSTADEVFNQCGDGASFCIYVSKSDSGGYYLDYYSLITVNPKPKPVKPGTDS